LLACFCRVLVTVCSVCAAAVWFDPFVCAAAVWFDPFVCTAAVWFDPFVCAAALSVEVSGWGFHLEMATVHSDGWGYVHTRTPKVLLLQRRSIKACLSSRLWFGMGKSVTRETEELYPGNPRFLRQIGSILSNGTFEPRPRLPVRGEIRHVDLVVGGTLQRVSLLSCTLRDLTARRVPPYGTVTALIKEPSGAQLSAGCDRCPGQHHRLTNPVCSANIGSRSGFRVGVVYGLRSGAAVLRTLSSVAVAETERFVTLCTFRVVYV
jgi:hypothetical protein